MNNAKRFKIFNTYVDALSLDETIQAVERIISERKPTQHVVINASKVNIMQKDKKLTDIINSCSLINADGASIVWASKVLGIPLKERVTGIDLFMSLIELANEKKYKIYLFGAKEEVIIRVKEIFETKYPNLNITGYRNGYFAESDEPAIVENMAESRADMMFVAFSSPKKEYWVNKYINQLNIPFVMGVGGSFDVVAGVTERAPIWMQQHSLEWFYRLIQEPRRMWRRYIIGNAKFVLLTYKTKFKMAKTH
ncbi:WecB/TagA/CpsF family glycosyltransferase [Aminipila terrae]|uniref:WecB/TagA/CpsF family glycosyltransferase n=1 Tax=Aminipila terrae TaxID=2697030 RepID=A0A6P1MB88_9FIRM|nr:WecB/TagA/CpsF family glycosyltransferase [Aminipila terrae]QHI71302.1 WecB/TagA/CpsF family glycosyltransferase [Aminipila terrae]